MRVRRHRGAVGKFTNPSAEVVYCVGLLGAVMERFRPDLGSDWITPNQNFWDCWHADEKFREQFVIRKINGIWWVRRRTKYPCKPDVKPADPFVRSIFREARKARGKRAATDIWDDLIGYLLWLPNPDRK